MLCKCHRTVLYNVYFTAFCLGAVFFPDTVYIKISAWRDIVLAADARNAGCASETTRLIPKPPSLNGRLAWILCLSDKSQMVVRWTATLNNTSKRWREGREMDGEQRRRWRTWGVVDGNAVEINRWQLRLHWNRFHLWRLLLPRH